ncbi:hypothetical protein I9W82_002039 [Candida metapsilosis]|uniref:Uncharacterized protein n=1 Tax=Candida metapsilosis TaxID=273372 RepID=A0A8H7ZGK5_9ASCO|nr:hypothetical protein I9W82_002039 [Candida metapsilosis]
MDNSLISLVNSYELDQTELAIRHQEKFNTQSSKPNHYMSSSHNGNTTARNSQRYVPPHRKQSTKGAPTKDASDGKAMKNNTSLTEEEKMAKRRERFSSNSNTAKQSQEYGLVSRGEDTRLKESETLREEYFLTILHQFIKYTSSNTSKSLSEAFKTIKDSDPRDFENAQSLKANVAKDGQTITMETLAMSLRKLRESLLHLKPSPFHKKVFLFSTRISCCCGQYQTYIPSINYLLSHKGALKLSSLEIEEVATILVLHLTHFNNDIPQAIQLYFQYIPDREDILQIIRSWVHKDYFTWVSIYNSVESFAVKSMMRLGQSVMLNRMIKVLSSSYFTIRKSVIERDLLPDDVEYNDFVKNYKVNWTVEGGVVTIRRRQTKVRK